MRFIAFDPSINNMGFAIFHDENLVTYSIIKSIPSHKNTISKLRHITIMLNGIMTCTNLDYCVIEIPDYWQNDRARKKDMFTLHEVIGLVIGFFMFSNCEIQTVTPRIWKGNAPKEVTERNMMLIYGLPNDLTDHEYDAIGIGHWFLSQQRIKDAII